MQHESLRACIAPQVLERVIKAEYDLARLVYVPRMHSQQFHVAI